MGHTLRFAGATVSPLQTSGFFFSVRCQEPWSRALHRRERGRAALQPGAEHPAWEMRPRASAAAAAAAAAAVGGRGAGLTHLLPCQSCASP